MVQQTEGINLSPIKLTQRDYIVEIVNVDMYKFEIYPKLFMCSEEDCNQGDFVIELLKNDGISEISTVPTEVMLSSSWFDDNTYEKVITLSPTTTEGHQMSF